MRQGQQHRRGRSRHNNNGNSNNSGNSNNNHRKGQNPLTRSFESNGPDVKVRGTPAHIAEKYVTLARDAQSSGDPVLAENYLQHAEHYNRIIFAYREQQMQQGGEVASGGVNTHARMRLAGDPIDSDEDGDDESGQDDFGHGEQPSVARFPHEMQRAEGQRQDDGQNRPQRPNDQQSGRFRDRYERQDRPDRQDRQGDRTERFSGDRDRGGDRGDRYERQPQGERSGQQNDRSQGERQDRFRDRPQRFADRRDQQQQQDRQPDRLLPERLAHERSHQDRFVEQPSIPVVERNEDLRAMPALEVPPLVPRDVAPVSDAPTAVVAREEAPAAAPRRRERFAAAAGMDQPEFLRRPVRRARREPEATPAPEAQPVTDEPTRE